MSQSQSDITVTFMLVKLILKLDIQNQWIPNAKQTKNKNGTARKQAILVLFATSRMLLNLKKKR